MQAASKILERLTHKCEKPTTLLKNGRWYSQKRKKILKTSPLGFQSLERSGLGQLILLVGTLTEEVALHGDLRVRAACDSNAEQKVAAEEGVGTIDRWGKKFARAVKRGAFMLNQECTKGITW